MEFFEFHRKRNPYFRNKLWSCLKMKEETCLWASSQAIGRDYGILKCVSRNLIRIWKNCAHRFPMAPSLWKYVTEFRSIVESWDDKNYNQSLVIWLYKMISDSIKMMKGNYFSSLPMNWTSFTASASLNIPEKYGGSIAFGKTQHITSFSMMAFDSVSTS